MSDNAAGGIERLEDDIADYTNDCVADYASHVDDSDIAAALRTIADRYDPEEGSA